MHIELICDPEKKKDSIRKLSRGSYQIGSYYFFLKAFSVFRWLAPVLLVVIQTIQTAIRGTGFKSYELMAMGVKCLTLFVAFAFGRWFLQFFVKKITGGLSLSNKNEKIVIDESGVLKYSYTYKRRRRVENIPLYNVQITYNEEVDILRFSGKIAVCKEKKNGSLIPVKEIPSEILADYYVPGLVDTLQNFQRGEKS